MSKQILCRWNEKEEWQQRASVKWTASPWGWEQAELPIAICFHWWEHQWGCCHLCAACANQGRGEQFLELGAVLLPALPLAISLTPALENWFCEKVYLPPWRGKVRSKMPLQTVLHQSWSTPFPHSFINIDLVSSSHTGPCRISFISQQRHMHSMYVSGIIVMIPET